MKTFACIILLSLALSAGVPTVTTSLRPVPIVLVVEWRSGRGARRRNHYRRRINPDL